MPGSELDSKRTGPLLRISIRAVLIVVCLGSVWLAYFVYLLDVRRDAEPTGSPDFKKKWHEWKNLPESKKLVWLAEPDFKWMDDCLRLLSVSDSEISKVDFRSWVDSGFGFGDVPNDKLASIDQNTIEYLRSNGVMFDCRPFLLNESLKSEIRNAPNLRWLRLSRQFAADDLAWISELVALEGLALDGIELNRTDLAVLENLQNLKWLELESGANFKLSSLPDLPNLEVLRMTGIDFGDRHLPREDQYPNLKCLDVGSSSVTDVGVGTIVESCPQLVWLDLGWCKGITKDCVTPLAKLEQLQYLYLNRTPLENHVAWEYQTIPELQIKLPKCHIRIGER